MAKAKNDEDLLDTLTERPDDNGTFDLLNELTEDDDSEPWMPEPGEGIQGTVIGRSWTKSDFTTEPIPVVLVEVDGERRRITGFASVLRNEIASNDPQPGDVFAVKYFGKKERNGKTYHLYRAAVRRSTPAPAKATAKPPF